MHASVFEVTVVFEFNKQTFLNKFLFLIGLKQLDYYRFWFVQQTYT